jgi:hypothetical protein
MKGQLSHLQQERLGKAIASESIEPIDDDFEDIWLEVKAEQAEQEQQRHRGGDNAQEWYMDLAANEWHDTLSESEKSILFNDYSIPGELSSLIHNKDAKKEPGLIHKGGFLSFIRKTINSLCVTPRSVLDPVCGYGDIVHLVGTATNAEVVHGMTASPLDFSVATELHGQLCNPKATKIIKSHYMDVVDDLLDQYDLVIADALPSTRKLDFCGNEMTEAQLHLSLIEFAGARLADDGFFVLIVEPTFFATHNKQEILGGVVGAGLRINSIIYLPSGESTEAKQDGYLLMLQKGLQEKVIVGCMKEDPNHQRALLNNIKARKFKGDASLGRHRDLDDFTSFERVSNQESLQRIAREKGWLPQLGINVFLNHEVVGPCEPAMMLQSGSSSLYLNLTGRLVAGMSIDGFNTEYNQVAHLIVDPCISSPQYLEYLFNETSYGDLFLRSLRLPGRLPRIYISQLLVAEIYLPTVERQRQIIDSMHRINRIRSEADELYQDLVDGSDDLDMIADRICEINRNDRFLDWIDTLPFPLASILWRYHASQSSDSQSYDALFNLFEATAAFVATVHLSAFRRDLDRWNQSARGLSSKLSHGKVSLERASFGSWRITTEYLGSLASKELTEEKHGTYNSARAHKLYATRNRRVLEMITSKRLFHILQTVNKLRNDWKGHSGAIGVEQARLIHHQLRDQVEQLRSVFGRSWTSYQLIRPGKMTYQDGVYTVECQLLMGARNSPFAEAVIETDEVMDKRFLYLYDRIQGSVLKLVPFIDVVPSPEKETMACFIYSRLEKETARWVSYHYDKSSEIQHAPDGLAKMISEIKQA